ncbi:MAG TPA: DUF1937 family protein [Clostridiaceae bacterium]
MKIYIAGKITGNENYKNQFWEAEKILEAAGHAVMNPANMNGGFEHHEYMKVCTTMIDVCEGVCFIKGWEDSKGAQFEHQYAKITGKTCIFV